MPALDGMPIRGRGVPDPIKSRGANRKILLGLVVIGICWLALAEPARHWSGSIHISSAVVGLTLQSDIVRVGDISRHHSTKSKQISPPDGTHIWFDFTTTDRDRSLDDYERGYDRSY